MTTRSGLYAIADELRALANAGFHYDRDPYAQARSRQALELSARLVAALEDRTAAQILEAYAGDFSRMSPAAGVDLAVFREGRVLPGAPHQAA